MTPQEKAKELVGKFNGYVIENEGFSYAKQCALMFVKELMNEVDEIAECYDLYKADDRHKWYWLQVKQQIENI